jgi:putative thioredoxin
MVVMDVNQADFQQQVIQKSHTVPVVVDFWAPWCGPCRMLGPILERLAMASNGRFLLAKVNADHNPQLSMQYQVRGIPAVKAFYNGRVVDEFVGAQPEPMVRQFIQRVTAQVGSATPKTQQPASLAQAQQLLRQGKGCEAKAQLQHLDSMTAKKLLPVAEFMCGSNLDNGRADLNTFYQQAANAARRREFAGAFYNLLAVVNQEPNYGNARAVMLGLFELLGANDALVQAYRSQLEALGIKG